MINGSVVRKIIELDDGFSVAMLHYWRVNHDFYQFGVKSTGRNIKRPANLGQCKSNHFSSWFHEKQIMLCLSQNGSLTLPSWPLKYRGKWYQWIQRSPMFITYNQTNPFWLTKTHFQHVRILPWSPSRSKKSPCINHCRVEQIATVGSIVLRSDASQDLAMRRLGSEKPAGRNEVPGLVNIQKANWKMAHRNSWFTELKHSDFPVRYISLPRVTYDQANPDVDWCLLYQIIRM